MKKLILGVTVVALLASCTNNEVTDSGVGIGKSPSLIAFQPTSSATIARGTVADIATLQNLANGFTVFGIANVGDQPSGKTASNLFDGISDTQYKYQTSVWDWVDQTGKTWPQATDGKYPIRFFAAYEAPSGLAWDAGTQTITPADNVNNQKDILSATTAVLAGLPSTNTTALQFKHILSAIQFKIQSAEGYKVDIKDVKIINVTKERAFNFLSQSWETLSTKQEQTYTYFHSSTGNAMQAFDFAKVSGNVPVHTILTNGSTDNSQENGQLMLVPQTGSPMNMTDYIEAAKNWNKTDTWPTVDATTALNKGAYIQLSYKMRDDTGKDIVGWTNGNTSNGSTVPTANYYVTVIYPLDLSTAATGKAWEMGKRYTYTIHLGTPDSSNGTVADPEFKGDDDTPTGTPTDNPNVDPGSPVTQGKITFTVTVDSWTDTDGAVDIM